MKFKVRPNSNGVSEDVIFDLSKQSNKEMYVFIHDTNDVGWNVLLGDLILADEDLEDSDKKHPPGSIKDLVGQDMISLSINFK